MAAAGLEDQIARLEAVATRLEQVALRAGKKSGGGGPELSEAAEAFVDLRKNEIEACLKALDGIPGYLDCVSPLSEKLRAAYDNVTDYVCKTSVCAKPTPQEMPKALAPLVEALNYYEGLIYDRRKGMLDFQFHHKALKAACDAMLFVTMYPPAQIPKTAVNSAVGDVSFNTNKILMKIGKDDHNKELSKTFTVMGKKLEELIKEHFLQGLDFTGQKNILEAEGVAPKVAAAPVEEEKPKAAAKKTPEKPKNSEGFAAELSKGLAVTAKLKKVKKSQKNKYKKDKVSGKVTGGVKKAKAKKKLPDPKKTKRGNTWYLEYYQEGLITINQDLLPKLEEKIGIYIAGCINCQFLVAEGVKLKSIVMDGCNRVQVQNGDIVSTIEMVNCKNCTLWMNGVTPAVTLDKCDSPKLVIMPPCWEQEKMVEILTSNVTAGNVELPPNGDEDGEVIPIVEQYYLDINKETREGSMRPMEHAG